MLPEGYKIKTAIHYRDVVVHLTKKKLTNNQEIAEPLGEGGQGAVYEIDYDGKSGQKVLKWYTGTKFKNPKKFYDNLYNNVKKGKPTDAFLWPEDITEHAGEAFGYVMNKRPKEYKDFSKFLIGKEKFAGMTARVNTALHITAGFRALHNSGYSYQDLNDGNFFINPENGDVLICDNDNVSEYGKSSGIAGKARYMAPEIVADKKQPDMYTDRFSLAVVLFLLFTHNHPLEGKGACPVCMDAQHEFDIYGKKPVFVWDPADDSNRPVKGLHQGAIVGWAALPQYAKDMFTKAFSKDVMKLQNNATRIIEQDWLRLFVRMRSEIFKCACGDKSIYFADPVNPNPCPKCGKVNTFPMYIQAKRYNVAVHGRTKLYACQVDSASEDYKTQIGAVAFNNGTFELKNMSGKNWMVADGANTITVAPNASCVLKKGIKINFGQESAEVI